MKLAVAIVLAAIILGASGVAVAVIMRPSETANAPSSQVVCNEVIVRVNPGSELTFDEPKYEKVKRCKAVAIP